MSPPLATSVSAATTTVTCTCVLPSRCMTTMTTATVTCASTCVTSGAVVTPSPLTSPATPRATPRPKSPFTAKAPFAAAASSPPTPSVVAVVILHSVRAPLIPAFVATLLASVVSSGSVPSPIYLSTSLPRPLSITMVVSCAGSGGQLRIHCTIRNASYRLLCLAQRDAMIGSDITDRMHRRNVTCAH
eukprot:Opistho-2@88359